MNKTELNLEHLSSFSNLDLLATQLVEGFITGLHKSPFHGFSVEFAEHRPYNYGESTKFIDWKVYGKTDKLFIKKYEEETNLRCQFLLDVSSSMYYPEKTHTKIKYASLACASLAYLLQKQRDAFGLTLFDEEIKYQSQIKSTFTHFNQILIQLQSLFEPNDELRPTQISKVIHQVAEHINRRSLVVLFSDFFNKTESLDDIFNALQHLKHRKNEIIIFHITDPVHEKDFNFSNRPHVFVDLETGEKVKLMPNEVKNSYQKALNQYYNEIKLRCGQMKIDFVEIDINQGFDTLFLSFLQKRKKMNR